MKRFGRYWTLLGLSVAAVSALTGRAAGAMESYTYVPSNTSFTTQPGATTTVGLYLQLGGTGATPASSIVSTETGLYSAGVLVSRISGAAQVSSLTADQADFNNGAGTSGGGFYGTTIASDNSSGYLSEAEGVSAAAGVVFGNTGAGAGTPSANEIFLGTVTITAPSTAGTTTFNVGRVGKTNTTVTYTNGYDMDYGPGPSTDAFTPVGTQVGSFTVTVTPEPASLGLVGAVGLLALRRRRFSR